MSTTTQKRRQNGQKKKRKKKRQKKKRKKKRRKKKRRKKSKKVRYRTSVNKRGLWRAASRVAGTAVSILSVGKMAKDFADGMRGIRRRAQRQKNNAVMEGLNLFL